MVPVSAVHAYVSVLPLWFWMSNLLCIAALFNIRGLGQKSWGRLVIALPLLSVAIGNAILLYQATILFAGKLSPTELVNLKVPTIITTVIWGGIGMSLVVKWVNSRLGP